MTMQWRVYNTATETFEDDVTANVTCFCEIASGCSAVEFILADTGSSPFDQVFTLVTSNAANSTTSAVAGSYPELYNGQPILRSEDSNMFLFYNRPTKSTAHEDCDDGGGFWTVSGALWTDGLSGAVIGPSYDGSLPVVDVAGGGRGAIWWTYSWELGRFDNDTSLQLACLTRTRLSDR
jgi:hypothetical protein